MKYAALKARVAAAERRVGEHLDDAGRQVATMQATVKEAVTPARILVGGLLGGLLTGWLRPLKRARVLPSLVRFAAGVPSLLAAVEPLLAPLRQAMDAARAQQQVSGNDGPAES